MRILKGNPVSRGIALGKVYIYKAFKADVHESYFEAGKEDEYFEKYEDAVRTAEKELENIIDSMSVESPEKAKIFTAHVEILMDEEVAEGVKEMIYDNRTMPDYAVDEVYTDFANLLEKAKDPLIAARAADLRDVRNRVLRILKGEKESNLSSLRDSVIVVAHDLLPSDTATMDREHVMGIITEVGGATSHTAIIARSYKIPALLGVSDATEIMKNGDNVIMDALTGKVLLDPEKETIKEYQEKLVEYIKEERETGQYLDKIPLVASGERFSIGLNVGSTDPDESFKYVDFVGLFRTEFVYMNSEHMPTEQEQFDSYKKVLANAMGNPVTLRTLDIGGDKTLRYLALPKEDNPFLGNRALRLCLDHPEMFKTQLRAALRASALGPLQIMFPMVGTMDDIRAGKAAVEEAKQELRKQGIAFDEKINVGIMIEIPSIAMIADMAAKEVDFASVGTNDLTQYLHAVDRMNPAITEYFQSMSPSMFRILGRIFAEFNKAGKPVSVCGELAGDHLGALVMFGLGLRKFSMNSANIARVKRTLSLFTLEEAENIAKTAQNLATEADVIAYVKAEVDKRS
ncbi:MAG: phosphoenolpyruvate--protein phosphotransferase [Anaerolineaceae bacterium]|nr:phosphoenolpyruvate--protein phosphotransferase [Anaerolineaceae bacterium]MDD4042601.1 phosphoenolpyruvate--protein phosphotransferase [Anaerolineaceae bacterium]MDD4577214.1 phosphoenolpyruvate--protein phosphotransferase [Anaerolineaceae bacterium]